MGDKSSSDQPQVVCPICAQAVLRPVQRLLAQTVSHYLCSFCGTRFIPDNDKFIVRDTPPGFTKWKDLQGKLLTWNEIIQVANGVNPFASASEEEWRQYFERPGVSSRDREEYYERARGRSLKQDEDVSKQCPDTEPQATSNPALVSAESFMTRAKEILGIPVSESTGRLELLIDSAEHVQQSLVRITELKKQLKELRRDANSQIASLSSARARRPYEAVIDQINSFVLQLDTLKSQVENPSAGRSARKPVTMSGRLTSDSKRQAEKPHADEFDVDTLLEEFNQLVGLDSVKSSVVELINFLKVRKIREAKGLPTPPVTLHTVFYGNPGTGKTTVARLLAKIYRSLGFLSKGHLIETDRSGLVAGYVGQTALKVNEVVSKALGGILFIDEAYALSPKSGNDYGQEAIDTLIKQMEDNRETLVVVVAGYTDKMDEFLASNPGFRSRFNRYLKFEDYTPDQLFLILDLLCAKSGFHLSEKARTKATDIFRTQYDQRDMSFGNARLVRNLFESAISHQASRIVTVNPITDELLTRIDAEDLRQMPAIDNLV